MAELRIPLDILDLEILSQTLDGKGEIILSVKSSKTKFIDHILVYLQEPHGHEFILRFLLRQGWLDGNKKRHFVLENVFQDRTQQILKKLNFEWVPISEVIFRNYLDIIRKAEKLQ